LARGGSVWAPAVARLAVAGGGGVCASRGEQRLLIGDARAGETGEAARAGRGRTAVRVPGRGQAGSVDSAAPRRACCLGGPWPREGAVSGDAPRLMARARCDVGRPKLFSCVPV
jgi:hypothetical protein